MLAFAPWLMKFLSVAGTAAMFLVGGGILSHGISWIDHWVKGVALHSAGQTGVEAVAAAMTPILTNLAVGLVAGALALLVVNGVRRVWPGKAHA